MPALININGVITTPEEAKISVLDHGLLFGDSVYETLPRPTLENPFCSRVIMLGWSIPQPRSI